MNQEKDSKLPAASSSPPSKRRKDNEGVALDAGMSWRDKSIKQFGLLDLPDGWKDSVARGTEDAWKKYYEYRIKAEGKQNKYEEDNGFFSKWTSDMNDRIRTLMAPNCTWHWKPQLGHIEWEDCDSLRSGNYSANVWSPYAIPHAVELNHRYHSRARIDTFEFFTTWSYRLIDFEKEETIKNKEFQELCSNCYEDEELRADVIDDEHLNEKTCSLLRNFLFGSDSEHSKSITCSDMNFWLLVFGSMGTTDPDFGGDAMDGGVGYHWQTRDVRKKLYDLKAGPEGEDSDPNGKYEDYYPDGCSWLKYKVLKITNNLGPITKHYEPPTIKDAPGWSEEWQEKQGRMQKEQEILHALGYYDYGDY